MNAIKQIMKIPKNHELLIRVPEYVPENVPIEVILLINENKSYKEKIIIMKMSKTDILFHNDLSDTIEDYKFIDSSDWERAFLKQAN